MPVTWDVQNTRYPCPIHTGPISPSDNIQWYSCDPLLLLLHPGPFLCCPNATEHVGFRHTHICPDSDNNVRLKKRENELIKEVRHDYWVHVRLITWLQRFSVSHLKSVSSYSDLNQAGSVARFITVIFYIIYFTFLGLLKIYETGYYLSPVGVGRGNNFGRVTVMHKAL